MKYDEENNKEHLKRYRVVYADPPWDIAQKGARGANQVGDRPRHKAAEKVQALHREGCVSEVRGGAVRTD
jgi:hypothetical protein